MPIKIIKNVLNLQTKSLRIMFFNGLTKKLNNNERLRYKAIIPFYFVSHIYNTRADKIWMSCSYMYTLTCIYKRPTVSLTFFVYWNKVICVNIKKEILIFVVLLGFSILLLYRSSQVLKSNINIHSLTAFD